MKSENGKKNILVVGGAGYVGGAVTDFLIEGNKYNFKVYDNLMYEEWYRKPVDFIYGDVLDKEKLKPYLDWADCVIWLAAIVGDGACQLDEVFTVQVNQNSIKWLADNFNGRIIFTSTCSVYGAQNDVMLTEDSLTKPLSLYAYTKLRSEEILKNKDAVIFRLGTLYGVSDTYSRLRMDLVVNLMTARAYSTGKISVFGGSQFRPLLHVRDAAQAIAQSIEFSPMKKSEILNISSINIKIHDLAYEIKKYFPDLIIETTEMPFEDTRNYQVSSEKAKNFFHFNPKYSLSDGIEQLSVILKNQRIKNFNNPRYSNQLFLKDVLM